MELQLKRGMMKLRTTTLKTQSSTQKQVTLLKSYGKILKELDLDLPHQRMEVIMSSQITILQETTLANSPKTSFQNDS